MPITIDVPTDSWAEQSIALGSVVYRFIYKYNNRNARLYLDIFQEEELVVGGLAMMEGGRLLQNYTLPNFNHGDIACVKFKQTDSAPTSGNVGIGLAYELIYYTNEELGE